MKTTREQIEQLTKTLSEMTGENYVLDYQKCYGGYELIAVDPERPGIIVPDKYGLYTIADGRMTAKEMHAYLCGILKGWRAKTVSKYL